MYPATHAQTHPHKPAYIMASTGKVVTYRQLDERSNRCAHLFAALGLRPGDGIALCLENYPQWFGIIWAAQRSGLYYTPISSRLLAPEVEYIVNDCGATVFLTSMAKSDVAHALSGRLPHVHTALMLDGTVPGYTSYEAAVASYPAEPLPVELEGQDMLYSSGTTGRPKGVKVPLPGHPAGTPPPQVERLIHLYAMHAATL